jgi:hypothetical protein
LTWKGTSQKPGCDLWLALVWQDSAKVPKSPKTAVGALADYDMIHNVNL